VFDDIKKRGRFHQSLLNAGEGEPVAARKLGGQDRCDSYLGPFNVSKILPFIRRAISDAGSGFWHSDSGLSQKFELGNISNRLRAAAPRQVSGSLT
jgi:hypothetical protein